MPEARSSLLFVAGFFRLVGSAEGADIVPSAATQTCLTNNPGLKAMVQGERLVALYGVPFATRDDYRAANNAQEFVQLFLDDPANADANPNNEPSHLSLREFVKDSGGGCSPIRWTRR